MNLKHSVSLMTFLLSINVLMTSCELGSSENEVMPDIRSDNSPSSETISVTPFSIFDRDYDGDGSADQLSVVTGGISIFHPATGNSSFYSFNGSFAINTAAEMNGTVGFEVSVVTVNGITVLVDKSKTSSFYSFSGNFAINSTTDTNGVSGKEIIVITTNGIVIINQKKKSSRLYSILGSYSIVSVSNKDGQPGNEIVFSKSGNQFMIVDRTGATIPL